MNDLSASDIIRQDLAAGQVPAGIEELVSELRARYPQSLQAVVYYGSCRRKADNAEGLVDLLALVSNYSACHGPGLTAIANRLLPPNVYYLEARDDQKRYRCKYALVSLPEFLRRCHGGLDGYFWARFSQPCRLAWSMNEAATTAVVEARAAAVTTFAIRAAPLMAGSTRDACDFWGQALAASYRCELRPERKGAALNLVQADPGYWKAISATVLPGISGITAQANDCYRIESPPVVRWRTHCEWQLRRIWGKTLNIARLFKAAGTFSNGIDYLLWKVERHSGVRVQATTTMRRYPRLAAFGLAWRLWRMGGFR